MREAQWCCKTPISSEPSWEAVALGITCDSENDGLIWMREETDSRGREHNPWDHSLSEFRLDPHQLCDLGQVN